MAQAKYKVTAGPEAYLSPAAAIMGVTLPDKGGALVEGEVVSADAAIDVVARKLAEAKNPAICPGPMLLWNWDDGAEAKAAAVRELAAACGAKILPMIDYSAKRIRADMEISPNHPNVSLLHNGVDVCVFVGIHSHYVNLAARLVRGRTSCYTIALDDLVGTDEAMVCLRDVGVSMISEITEKVKTWRSHGCSC